MEQPRSTAHVDALLAEALAEQRSPGASQPLAQENDSRFPPPSRQHNPTVPRLFAPPLPGELRTDTARKLSRPPPVWMVAGGAFVAALVAAAMVIAFASWGARQAAPIAVAPAATTASPRAPTTTTALASTGPFGAARSAFALAIAVGPSTQAPSPPPAVAPPLPAAPPPAAVAPPPQTSAPASAPPPVRAVSAPAARPIRRAAPETPAASGSDHGMLSIVCFPACDAVYDNGQMVGPSPILKRPVAVGEHKLRMTSSNPTASKVISVIVMADQITTVRQPMTP
jgi:hypothetical protein